MNEAPETTRLTLREMAVIFAFVGRWDDYAGNDRLTVNEIREAAARFAKEELEQSNTMLAEKIEQETWS